MEQVILTIKELRFCYPQGKGELYLEHLELNRGQKIFIEAPSGAGKTTLLSLVAGVLTPQSGTIELMGQPFSTLPETRRDYLRGQHIGYIFQQFNLLPHLTARQNLRLLDFIAPQRFQSMSQSEKLSQWQSLTEALQVESFLDQPASHLSMGQSQRIAVMRALLGRPSLVLADEPTSALDTVNRDSFVTLLEELCASRGIALLFVSHDPQLKARFDHCLKLTPMQTDN